MFKILILKIIIQKCLRILIYSNMFSLIRFHNLFYKICNVCLNINDSNTFLFNEITFFYIIAFLIEIALNLNVFIGLFSVRSQIKLNVKCKEIGNILIR